MKKLLLVALAFASFAVGYGVIAKAYSWPYGLAQFHGYFHNVYDDQGTYVLPRSYGGFAFPGWAYNAGGFIAFIESQLGGNSEQRSGASFIIQTMLGSPRGSSIPPSGAQINAWANLVNQYASLNKIDWSIGYCFTMNTYYQGTGSGPNPVDDAFYDESDCKTVILFHNPNGTTYAIKHECANPVGIPNPLGQWQNFNLSGTSAVTAGQNPLPGQQVQFTHTISNPGPTGTSPSTISWTVTNSGGGAPPGSASGNAGALGVGIWQTIQTVIVPVTAPPGSQVCQNISWSPENAGGGSGASVPACTTVQAPATSCVSSPTVNPGHPGNIDPTDTYTITAQIAVTGGAIGAQVIQNNSQFFIYVDGPGVSNHTNTNVPTTIIAAPQGLQGQATFPPTNQAGKYTVTYGLTGMSAVSCSSSFNVMYTPYFSIVEGDVSAGPGFGTACTPSLSKITGKNRGLGDNYYGAGSQLGAFALNQITDFASGITLNNGTGQGTNSLGGGVTQPWNLTFSNVGPLSNAVDSPWGESFGKDPTEDTVSSSTSCVPDYYTTATSGTTTPLALGTVTAGTFSAADNGKTFTYNGNLTISSLPSFGGAGAPSRLTIVVKGNVYLNSNVQYANYSYVSGTTNASSIPQFQLIVQGNIFVDQNVTTMTGFYAAQQGGANTGTMYTCSQGFNYLTNTSGDTGAYNKPDATYYQDCSQPLTIYGSVATNKVKLNRSGGALKKTPVVGNGPAEKIVYTPELWLGGLTNAVPSGGSQPFDAITNLPPIL